MAEKPNFLPTDFTHPNNDRKTAMQPAQQSSPLMEQLKGVWGVPWPKKPIPKAKSQSKSGPRTSRSGVHKLGRQSKKSGGWY